MLKVKFLSMTNEDSSIFAKFEVIKPKRLLIKGKIVDLTKLGKLSQVSKYGLFVGVEQTRRDSLYVTPGQTRIWEKGHTGYFNVANLLFTNPQICEELNAPSCWDGEWENEDIIDKVPESEVQQRIKKYILDIKYNKLMKNLWQGYDNVEKFRELCKNIPNNIVQTFIDEQLYWKCDDCGKRVTAISHLVDKKTQRITKKVCSDCSNKYKEIYIHGIMENGERTPGVLVRISSELKGSTEKEIHVEKVLLT